MAEKKRRPHESSVSDTKLPLKTPHLLSLKSIPFQKCLKLESTILESLKQLAFSVKNPPQSSSKKPTTPSKISPSLSSSCREVTDLSLSSIQSEIETLIFSLTKSILSENDFSFNVPSRASSNHLYIPKLDRIVLKDKSPSRPFAAVGTIHKATITTRIMSLIHQLCVKSIHVTKHDLFYTDVKLFQDQSQSDSVLDDVSCVLGYTRSSLNVVASEKGVVVGSIFSDNEDMIDCTKMGVGGKDIPPNIDRVGDMQSNALFVLLVEKYDVFMRLAEDRFYNRFPRIIITAKGQPDVTIDFHA